MEIKKIIRILLGGLISELAYLLNAAGGGKAITASVVIALKIDFIIIKIKN